MPWLPADFAVELREMKFPDATGGSVERLFVAKMRPARLDGQAPLDRGPTGVARGLPKHDPAAML
jgi:hypothetical protein